MTDSGTDEIRGPYYTGKENTSATQPTNIPIMNKEVDGERFREWGQTGEKGSTWHLAKGDPARLKRSP